MIKVLGLKKLLISISAAAFLCQNLSILPLPQVKAADISGRIIYVAENGNDYTGNGSSGSPYRSIKKAADEATAGTTVLIRPGTYIEEDIKPKESGKADAMIVFRPENTSDIGKPLDENKRMPICPYFMNFPAQKIESGLFSAFWDTGSTWDARWVNNVTYNLKNGISRDRSYNNDVINNISYEDNNSMYNSNDTVGLLVKETSVNGFHSWHGIDLKGGGSLTVQNNQWYSERKPEYARYMDPSQSNITVNALNAQLGTKTNSPENPMFADPAAGDFSLKEVRR